MCLHFLLLGVFSLTFDSVSTLSPRYKREELLFRRLESVTLRVQILEDDLRREQKATRALKDELERMKNASKGAAESEYIKAPKARHGMKEVSDEVVKRVADLARNELKSDLNVITSGLIAEKQMTAQMTEIVDSCKSDLTRFTSSLDYFQDTVVSVENRLNSVTDTVTEIDDRVDDMDVILMESGDQMGELEGNMKKMDSRLDGVDVHLSTVNKRLTSFNTTLTEVRKNFSKIAHGALTGTDLTSGKCPKYFLRDEPSSKKVSGIFTQDICDHNYKYVYVLKVLTKSSGPKGNSATALISTGIKVGSMKLKSRGVSSTGVAHIYRGSLVKLVLSSDCNWPNMNNGKLYWIFSDKLPGEQTGRGSLSLNDATVYDFGEPHSQNVRYFDAMLFALRRGIWTRFCPK